MLKNVLGIVGLLIVGLACEAHTATAAETLVVGKPGTPCPDAQYTTINAAVKAAARGDEIAIGPALYDEQITLTKPLWLHGRKVDGIGRILIQPSSFTVNGLGFEAVITVLNPEVVTIDNLAVDASKNAVAACTPGLAAIHFHNASGEIKNSAIFGAQLTNPLGCATGLPFGNGFGVQIDADKPGSY